MRETAIRVIELIPPYVATELGGPSKTTASAAGAMALDAFIAETMRLLAGDRDEVAVGSAANLATAAGLEPSRQVFAAMNR